MNIIRDQLSIFVPVSIPHEYTGDFEAKFVFSPLTSGFARPLGHMLRACLLAHTPCPALTAIKIGDLAHKYGRVHGLREDANTVIHRFRDIPITCKNPFDGEIQMQLTFPAKPAAITCKDLPEISGLSFPAKDTLLFHTTGTDELQITLHFVCDRPSSQINPGSEKKPTEYDVNTIYVEPFFNAVLRVSTEFQQHTRGFESLILRVTANHRDPVPLVQAAIKTCFAELGGALVDASMTQSTAQTEMNTSHLMSKPIETLSINPVIQNILKQSGVNTISDLVNIQPDLVQATPELTEPVMKAVASALKSLHKGLEMHHMQL